MFVVRRVIWKRRKRRVEREEGLAWHDLAPCDEVFFFLASFLFFLRPF